MTKHTEGCGKEKECEGDVCKCKSGYKEDPEIANPEETDDCVYDIVTDRGRKNCSVSKRCFLFLRTCFPVFSM